MKFEFFLESQKKKQLWVNTNPHPPYWWKCQWREKSSCQFDWSGGHWKGPANGLMLSNTCLSTARYMVTDPWFTFGGIEDFLCEFLRGALPHSQVSHALSSTSTGQVRNFSALCKQARASGHVNYRTLHCLVCRLAEAASEGWIPRCSGAFKRKLSHYKSTSHTRQASNYSRLPNSRFQ